MELKKLLCCILLTVGCTLPGYAQDQPWARYADVEAGIEQPSFPERNFLITDFGARPDDSLALCHEAIDRAILACSLAGGGHVVVPQGTFYTGPITLKSNVDLHLEKGACLKFSTDKALYTPTVLTRWEGVDCYNLRPLIYARGETNLAITGQGTIDGQADNDSWWHMCGNAERFGWREGMISAARGGRERLLGFGETQTPVALRQMTLEDGLRPQLINLCHCTRVLIEGVTIKDSPFWTIHPVLCDNVIVRGVTIDSHFPNNDGCDPEGTSNVLIERCTFRTGDDAIAIKSGRDTDGRSIGRPSRNIVIRDCIFHSECNGLCIGSEMSGGASDVYMSNIEIGTVKNALYFKSNRDRGGYIRRVFVDSITVERAKGAILRFETNYFGFRGGNYQALYEDFHISHVQAGKADHYAVFMDGNEVYPIRNVRIHDFHVGEAPHAHYLKNTEGVRFTSSSVNGTPLPEQPEESPERVTLEVY